MKILTSADWAELTAMNKIRPILDDGDDFRAAIIRQAVCGGKISEHEITKNHLNSGAPKKPSDSELKAKLLAYYPKG